MGFIQVYFLKCIGQLYGAVLFVFSFQEVFCLRGGCSLFFSRGVFYYFYVNPTHESIFSVGCSVRCAILA